MKKLMIAGAFAAALFPAAAFAQAAAPADAMATGSTTADVTGNYTIDLRVGTGVANAGEPGEGRATPDSIARTLAANPGLEDQLARQNVTADKIDQISVKPNGIVTVWTKA